MGDKYEVQIDSQLELSKIDAQIEKLNNTKITLDVEVKKDSAAQLQNNINKSLKGIKVDSSNISKEIANAFNIKDKGVIGNIQSKLQSVFNSLANTWNGKSLDIGQASGFYDGLSEISDMVTKNASVIEKSMGVYDEFYNYFRNKKIYISDELKSALGDDLFKELQQNNIGKIVRDASKGVSIDSIWGEMTSMFPEHFSQNTLAEADQIVKAFDVLKLARADVSKVIDFSNMTPEQQFETAEAAVNQIYQSASQMMERLQTDLTNITAQDKSTFDLEVSVNTEKIKADIIGAVKSTSLGDAPINVLLNVNEQEIVSSIQSAIALLGGSDPIGVDIQINKQSLLADLENALDGVELPIKFNIDAQELESDIRKALDNIDEVEINVRFNTDRAFDYIGDAFNGNSVNDLYNSLGDVNAQGVKGQSVFQKFGSTLQEAFATFTVANILQDAIYKVVNVGEKAVETVKELNDEAKSLQMATGSSDSAVSGLMEQYNEMAKELGALTQEVSSGADSWLRQGKTVEETNTLLEDSMILSKVSNLDSAKSTEYLTSAMNSYKVAVEDVIDIVDQASSIDMAAAVDAGGLMEAMSKTATIANMADVSMSRLFSYLATVGEVTQKSMSSVGEGFKTIFTRMSDIKAEKLELVDEDGTTELLSDVELTLKNVGIDLRETMTEYNSYQDVLDSLASKWSSLNEVQQNAISKAFAGVRQQENFRVLMENYDRVLKYTSIAENSSGTAMNKFENVYLDSLEAKTNSLKASLQDLATTTISDEMYGSVLDLAQAMVEVTTESGLLKGALAGIATSGGLFAISSIANTVKSATQEFSNLSAAMDIVKAGNIGEDSFKTLMGLTEGLSKSQLKLVLSTTSLSDAQKIAILMNTGMSQAEAQAALSAMGLATAQGTATTATVTLSGALKGLWATLMANPLVLVAMGVTAAFTAFNAYENKVKESINTAKEAGSAWSETNDSMSENISKINELRSALDSGTLSEQESEDAKQQLLDIQSKLSDSYGTQVEGINLVNGSLEEQISLLNELSRQQANEFLNENKSAIAKADKEMTKNRNTYLGTFSDNGDVYNNAFADVLAKYEDQGLHISKEADGITAHVSFIGDATEADTVLNNLMTDIRSFEQEYGETDFTSSISDKAAAGLETANEVLEEYKDLYEQAESAQLVVDTKVYGDKQASDWMSEYTQSVEKYNEALVNGDTSEIQRAKNEFEAVDSSVQDLLKDQNGLGQYRNIFSNIQNQVGATTNSVDEFTEAVKSAAQTASNASFGIEDLIIDANSTFSKANAALESENQGAAYDSMLEMAKKAKELQESGDIGTDDFKSIAAMFSPSGADDSVNFSENLGKINRYFTEDNSGLLNFLNDLKDKGFAELNKETQEWSYSIDDLEEAARKMGMGFEPFMAMFGKLEDKGFYNDFFTTQEEGMEVLSELYGDLGTAQMELDNLYANDPNNRSAIKAKEEEVAQLQERIKDTTNDLGKLFEKNAEDYAQEDKAARAGLNAQIEAFNANKGNMSEEAQNRMLADIQERGSEYGYGNIGIVEGQLVLDTTLADKAIEEIQDTELDEKVVELSCEDDATGYLILWNTLQANPKFTSLSAEDQATYILNLWNNMSADEKKAIVNGEDKATPMLNEIQSYEIKGKNFEINAEDKASGILSNVVSWFGKIKNKTATVTVNTKVTGDKVTGGTLTKADGTFHAHASGTNVAIREHQTALVNEVGNEGLVRNGMLQEIKGGAQLIKLRPGDIIFNHKQMEELKKRGHVTSGGGRGKLVGGGAFVDGTISAFSTGGGILTGTGSSGSNGKSGSSKDKSTNKKDSSKSSKQLVDWIAEKLDTLKTKAKRWAKVIENATDSAKITKYYNKLEANYKQQMKTNYDAASRYLSKANSVGLKSSLKKLVQGKDSSLFNKNGNLKSYKTLIKEYGESTADKITEYQNWYDKYQESIDSYIEACENLYNAPLEEAATKIEKFSDAIDLLDKKLENADGYKVQNDILNQQLAEQKKILSASKTAKKTADSNLKSAKKPLDTNKELKKFTDLSKNERANVLKSVKAGTEIDLTYFTEGSAGYKKALAYNTALKARSEALDQLSEQQEEYTNFLRESRMEQLENIKAEYDAKDAIVDANNSRLEAMNELKESQGKYLSSSDYSGLLANAKKTIENERAELEAYRKQFEKNRADMSDEDIAEAEANILEMEAGIIEATKAQQELNNEVANLPYEQYERALEYLDAIAEHRKSQIDLKEARGQDLSEQDYLDQISDNMKQISKLTEKQAQAYKDWQKAIANGGYYGGKSAQEWEKEYLSISSSINGIKEANEELKDSLRDDVYWRDFERAHKACEDLASVIEGMDGLIDEAMMYDTDTGLFTDLGVSHIANLVKQYENARDEVQNYTDDIQNLNKLYGQGMYTEEEYNEKLVELQENLFDSADAMKSYMESVKEMYKNQEQAELDKLYEVIDARNEALKKKQEYRDYDKNLKNQTKEIQLLEAERAALEGINTAEAKARKAQLDAEIAEQKEALDETVEQHLMDISSEALDSLKDTMQEAFEDRWENMDSNMQSMVGLMQTANELSTQNAAEIKNAMYKLLKYYGIDASATGLTSVTGYAGGTKKVPRDMIAMINESGAEMIVTKYGLLTPLSQGDGVIPADMTENLMNAAKYGITQPQIVVPNVQVPNNIENRSENVIFEIDNFLNVEGNTSAMTMDDFKRVEKDFMNKCYKFTTDKMFSGYLQTGGHRRI